MWSLARAFTAYCSREESSVVLKPIASPPPLVTAIMAKFHDFQEVARHKNRDDCWLIISGKVYDVTPFLEDHPGGDEVLLAATEKDATDDFEDVGHSDSAREMMEKYCIGEIDSSTIPAKKSIPPQKAVRIAEETGFGTKILQFLLPLLVLGIAFALRYFAKKEE